MLHQHALVVQLVYDIARLFRSADHGDEDVSMLQIGCHINALHGHQFCRESEFAQDHLPQLSLDQLVDALKSMGAHMS